MSEDGHFNKGDDGGLGLRKAFNSGLDTLTRDAKELAKELRLNLVVQSAVESGSGNAIIELEWISDGQGIYTKLKELVEQEGFQVSLKMPRRGCCEDPRPAWYCLKCRWNGGNTRLAGLRAMQESEEGTWYIPKPNECCPDGGTGGSNACWDCNAEDLRMHQNGSLKINLNE